MFYDEIQESSNPSVGEAVKKVIGIFLNIGEEGRSDEKWVNTLNDKAHLMRVNAFDKDNSPSVKRFKVSRTPYIILFDNGKAIFQEEVNDQTYSHIKKFYTDKNSKASGKNEAEKKNNTSNDSKKSNTENSTKNTDSSKDSGKNQGSKSVKKEDKPKSKSTPNSNKNDNKSGTEVVNEAEKKLKDAQDISTKSKKKVEDATKSLNDTQKQMEEYKKIEEAKKKADDAKLASDKAQKSIPGL